MRQAWGMAAAIIAATVLVALVVARYDDPTAGPARKRARGGDDDWGAELRPVGPDGLDAALKENKGKVVVVDFWATWCGACVEGFPHLVELHNRYAADGLACISVSMDEPKDKADVRDFLAVQRATFTNFLLDDTSPQTGTYVRRRFGYAGRIPHMAVFGRDGAMVWNTGISLRTPASVEQLVQDTLARK